MVIFARPESACKEESDESRRGLRSPTERNEAAGTFKRGRRGHSGISPATTSPLRCLPARQSRRRHWDCRAVGECVQRGGELGDDELIQAHPLAMGFALQGRMEGSRQAYDRSEEHTSELQSRFGISY